MHTKKSGLPSAGNGEPLAGFENISIWLITSNNVGNPRQKSNGDLYQSRGSREKKDRFKRDCGGRINNTWGWID